MAVALMTQDQLRDIAGFRAEDSCAISLYVGLDPSVTPTAGDADTRLNALLNELEKSVSRDDLSHGAREGLRADLERIRRFLDDEFDRDGVRGLAIFAAGDAFWRTVALPDPLPDIVELGSGFHLAPLAAVLGRYDRALVVVVTREQGRVYHVAPGRLEELADHTDEQPGKHDQGGWSQARYQRHIDKLVADHYRGVAEAVDDHVRRFAGPKIVLVAPEEQRSEFLATLAPETRDAVVGATSAEAHASDAELFELVQPVLAEARASEERELLDRWREEAGRDARAAAGWAETAEAASDGRVELLLFREGASRTLHQCPACQRGVAEAGTCPLDGAALEARPHGLDVLVERTLAHGGDVLVVRAHADLDPVEGVGALLRF